MAINYVSFSTTCGTSMNVFWGDTYNAATDSWTGVFGGTTVTTTELSVLSSPTPIQNFPTMHAPSAAGDMDPGLKARWLTALRDGSYTQRHGGFIGGVRNGCVLQILLWVAERERVSHGAMPWLDLGVTDQIAAYLMAQNDMGRTFAQLADWIEANVKTRPVPPERNFARELMEKLPLIREDVKSVETA